jgi:hypothetical protein
MHKFSKVEEGKKVSLVASKSSLFRASFSSFCFGLLGLALIPSNDCCFSDRNVCDVKKKQLAFPMMKFVSTVWNIFLSKNPIQQLLRPLSKALDLEYKVRPYGLLFT